MITLLLFLKSLLERDLSRQQDPAEEAYLSAAVDISDLERRMRVIDEDRRHALTGITLGLYPR